METQESICAWANETFGRPDTVLSIAERASKEMRELLCTLDVDDSDPKAAEEAADVIIVLMRVFERCGTNCWDEVAAKMAKNRARKWQLTGDGHGQHVREAP